MSKQLQSTILLLLTAIIWGGAFVAQREGMDHMGPFLFSGLRMYLASLSLVVIIFVNSLLKRPLGETQTAIEKKTEKDNLIKGGVLCGVIIFLAANFQQVGLVSVSAGKAGLLS